MLLAESLVSREEMIDDIFAGSKSIHFSSEVEEKQEA